MSRNRPFLVVDRKIMKIVGRFFTKEQATYYCKRTQTLPDCQREFCIAKRGGRKSIGAISTINL